MPAAADPAGVVKTRITMCRNIRTLYNFEPPATEDEIRASALQFVRKLSGFARPSQANRLAFDRAVDQVVARGRHSHALVLHQAKRAGRTPAVPGGWGGVSERFNIRSDRWPFIRACSAFASRASTTTRNSRSSLPT